jgi:hypothetical protein
MVRTDKKLTSRAEPQNPVPLRLSNYAVSATVAPSGVTSR